MKTSHYILITLLLMINQPSYSEIFKWVDKNGDIKFSDRKPQENKQAEILELKINTVKVPKHNKMVIIYSASWCGICTQAKKYFKQQRIQYKEYDVEKSAKGRKDYRRLKGKGVPIILFGDKRMNGFNIPYFDKMHRS